jgi:hypothetical protein
MTLTSIADRRHIRRGADGGNIVNMSDNEEEYKVGYEPVATRFKPGQSGNPKGRPKAKRAETALKRVVKEVLAEPVTIGGKKYGVLEVSIRNLANRAMKGELQAIKTLIAVQKEVGLDVPERRTGVLKVPVFLPGGEDEFTRKQQAKFRGEDPEGLAALNAPYAHLFDPPKTNS